MMRVSSKNVPQEKKKHINFLQECTFYKENNTNRNLKLHENVEYQGNNISLGSSRLGQLWFPINQIHTLINNFM